MSDSTLKRLEAIVPGRLMSQPAQLAAYESDGLTAFKSRPLVALDADDIFGP